MLTYVFEDDILLQYDIGNCDRQKYTSGNFFMIFFILLVFSTLFQFCAMRRKVKHKKIIVHMYYKNQIPFSPSGGAEI